MENKHCSHPGRRINDSTGVFLPAGKTVSVNFFSEWPHEHITTWKTSAPSSNRSAPWCLVLGSCTGLSGWGLQGPWQLAVSASSAQRQAAGCTQASSISTVVAFLNQCRRTAWTRPSAGNTPRSLPNVPAALQSVSHRRGWNSS